jgi:hypothetical protein
VSRCDRSLAFEEVCKVAATSNPGTGPARRDRFGPVDRRLAFAAARGRAGALFLVGMVCVVAGSAKTLPRGRPLVAVPALSVEQTARPWRPSAQRSRPPKPPSASGASLACRHDGKARKPCETGVSPDSDGQQKTLVRDGPAA